MSILNFKKFICQWSVTTAGCGHAREVKMAFYQSALINMTRKVIKLKRSV